MDVYLKFPGRRGLAILSVGMKHKPGDMPPSGYCDWHEWAEVQHKAGLRQKSCGRCCLWKFPQELSGVIETMKAFTSRGKEVELTSPVCLDCEAKEIERKSKV